MTDDRSEKPDDLATLVAEMQRFSDATPVGPARIPDAGGVRGGTRRGIALPGIPAGDVPRAVLVMAAVAAIIGASILSVGAIVGGAGEAPVARGGAEAVAGIPRQVAAPADWMPVDATPGRAAAVLSAERREGLARWIGGRGEAGVVTVSATTGAYAFLPVDLPEILAGPNPPWQLSPDGRYLAHWAGDAADPAWVTGVRILDLVTGGQETYTPDAELGILPGDLAWADVETVGVSYGVITRREGGTAPGQAYENSFGVAPVALVDVADGEPRAEIPAQEPLPAYLTSASSADPRGLGVLQRGVLRLVGPDGSIAARGRLDARLARSGDLTSQHLGPVGRWAVSIDGPASRPSRGQVLFQRFPGPSAAAPRGIAFTAEPSDLPGRASEIIAWSSPDRVVVRGRADAQPVVFDLAEAGGPARILVEGEGLAVRSTSAGQVAPQFAADLWLVPRASRPSPSMPLLAPERVRWAAPVLGVALVVLVLASRRGERRGARRTLRSHRGRA